MASKIDTEGALLGNMIVQVLEKAGCRSRTKCSSARQRSCAPRFLPGRSTSIPNTPATARLFFHLEDDPVWKDWARGCKPRSQTLDREKNHLVWLDTRHRPTTHG